MKASQGLPKSIQKRGQVKVIGSVSSPNLELSLKTSEKYYLTIQTVSSEKVRDEIRVTIDADSFFGFRHGLETLSQLITFDPVEKCLRIPLKAHISDAPIFPYRGILATMLKNFFGLNC